MTLRGQVLYVVLLILAAASVGGLVSFARVAEAVRERPALEARDELRWAARSALRAGAGVTSRTPTEVLEVRVWTASGRRFAAATRGGWRAEASARLEGGALVDWQERFGRE